MGLFAQIYKHKGQDCSICGLSSKTDNVVIVNADGPFEPDAEAPAVLLIQGPGHGRERIGANIVAVPAVYVDGQWVEKTNSAACRMCGGTFVHSCDTRFGEAVQALGGGRGPVSLHDRFETR